MKVLIIISVLLALAYGEAPVYNRQQNQQQRRYYFARQEEEPTTTYAPITEAAPYPPSGWKPDGPSFELPEKQVENSYGPPKSFGSRTSSLDQQYGAPVISQFQQRTSEENQRRQQQQQQQQQQGFGSFEFQARQQQQQRQFAASQNQYQQERQYLAPVSQQPINQYGVPEPQEQFQPPQPDQGYGVPVTDTTNTTEEPSTTTETEDSTTTSAPQTDSEVEPVNSVNELDEEGDLDEQQQEQQRGEYYVALPDGRLQRIRYVSHENVEAMKYFARIRAENVEPLRGPIYSYSPLQQLQFAPASLRLAPNPVLGTSSSASVTGTATSVKSSTSSGKLELQEEAAAAPSPPLAAVVQYSYESPSPVVPLGAVQSSASTYSANYRAPVPEQRYFITF